MKTVYVHPAEMRRLLSGNPAPIATRYGGSLTAGDTVEITDTDEAVSVITKVRGVEQRGRGLYRLTVADPATAFRPADVEPLTNPEQKP